MPVCPQHLGRGRIRQTGRRLGACRVRSVTRCDRVRGLSPPSRHAGGGPQPSDPRGGGRGVPAGVRGIREGVAQALGRAGAGFDLAPVEQVLDRWWGIAVIRANPLSEAEHAQVARAKAGDFTGLIARDERGNGVRL